VKRNKELIIAAAIIISGILISISLFNKPSSSLDHCYNKVYKFELEQNIIENDKFNKSLKEQGLPKSDYFTKEKAESDAARAARRKCRIK
tara:strand:+ start:89 stop:358 length:270 start_codon:yes stop_codon:yes gene_type:complete